MHHRAMLYEPYRPTIWCIRLIYFYDADFEVIRQALLFFISEISRRFLSIHAGSLDAMEAAILISWTSIRSNSSFQ